MIASVGSEVGAAVWAKVCVKMERVVSKTESGRKKRMFVFPCIRVDLQCVLRKFR